MSDYTKIVKRAAEVLACSQEAMSSRVFDTLTLDFARAVVDMGKELAQPSSNADVEEKLTAAVHRVYAKYGNDWEAFMRGVKADMDRGRDA